MADNQGLSDIWGKKNQRQRAKGGKQKNKETYPRGNEDNIFPPLRISRILVTIPERLKRIMYPYQRIGSIEKEQLQNRTKSLEIK